MRCASSSGAPTDALVDLEVLAQQCHTGLADPLGDQDLRPLAHEASLSTTQSMHAVSACTSAGSTAGNMPTRSWLRASLR